MVAGRKEGQTVYERFEALLREMGIEVTPEEEQEVAAEQSEEQGRANGDGAESHGQVNGVNGHQDETTQGTQDQAQIPVQPVTNGIKSALLQPPRKLNGLLERRSRSQDTYSKPFLEVVDTRGRLKARASSDNLPFRQKRAASTSTNHSLRIARGQEPIFATGDAYSADESENLSATRSRRHSFIGGVSPAQDAYIFLPPGLFQRSDEEMEEDVEAFQHSKALIAQRRILWQWRHKAVDLQRAHTRMETTAEDFDRAVLLRNALEQWRARAFERQQEREMSLYFSNQEARAIEMRDEMLKLKALTHWVALAEEKREKTSTARRQILRARYFTAWKGITAANDLKVRQHVLSKFIGLWRHRLEEVESGQYRAVARHEAKVKRRVYDKLVIEYCERAAPNFHAHQRLERFFRLWRDKVRLVQERNRHVLQMREHLLQQRMLNALAAKKQKVISMDAEAAEFRKKKLLGKNFGIWQTSARLQPLAAKVSHRNDTRILHTALFVWNRNAKMSQQATKVHESRITRNAFTNWNDILRIRYLEIRVAARLRAESFYKWIFATRETIATRERDVKIASSCLSQWAVKAHLRQQALEKASQAFVTAQRKTRLQGSLNILFSAFRKRQQQEADATAFRNRRLVLQTLSTLRTRNANLQEMNGKAAAARFYILTTSTLKNLKVATHHHQKARRRDAYAQIRRKSKMNLAREMLRKMQNRLAQIRAMEHTAAEKKEDRVMRIAISDFGAWKAKASGFVEQTRLATSMDKNRLLGNAFRRLQEKHAQLQELNKSATLFSTGWATVEAMTSLRRLRFRYLQLRHQEQGAQDLRDMHWQKHVKNMLRYWAARSTALQQGRLKRADRHDRGNSPEDEQFDEEEDGENMVPPGPGARGPGDLTIYETSAWNLGNLDLDLEVGDGGDIDFPVDGLFTSTPLPGYLRTPSKRNTARAKARQRFVNIPPPPSAVRAPATAPPRQQTSSAPPTFAGGITNFERKLREQGYPPRNGGSRTPGRGLGMSSRGSERRGRVGMAKTPGRSGNVGFAGFEDITEASEERSVK
jgi:protein SFI1